MKIIAHIDMDAFFAAVEERYNPQFRGLPLVVGADPRRGVGRGVVSTANYAARKYGIRSALPITQAWRFAEEARMRGEPETIFVTGNYSLYAEVSERIMSIIKNAGDRFEQSSVDEAYIEWKFQTPSTKSRTNTKLKNDEWEEAKKRAKKIKQRILDQEGLTCSVGIGPNKLVAKIASDFKKPDGLTVVETEDVEAFLAPMSIRAIPGIGPKSEQLLNAKGIQTISDLQKMPRDESVNLMGKWGSDLFEKARGISDSEVSNEWIPKSVGEQETFKEDTLQSSFILERLHELAGYVFMRFKGEGFHSFRTVVITVRFFDFTTQTRSHTSPKALRTVASLHGEALRLLLPFLDHRENPKRKKIRLIGIRVEKFG